MLRTYYIYSPRLLYARATYWSDALPYSSITVAQKAILLTVVFPVEGLVPKVQVREEWTHSQ
jgi:hypothetical protein